MNVYTATHNGTTVSIYNALTGSLVTSRQMQGPIEQCVCSGDILSVVVRTGANTKYSKTYRVPNFTELSSRVVS